jgi:hypothetical protein
VKLVELSMLSTERALRVAGVAAEDVDAVTAEPGFGPPQVVAAAGKSRSKSKRLRAQEGVPTHSSLDPLSC